MIVTTKIFASARLSSHWLARLREYGQVDHYDWSAAGRLLNAEELASRMRDSDILIVESDQVTAEMIRQSPQLKLIAVCRGGVINVDIDAASELGILVINAPGRNADAVADLTVCLMIMAARHVLSAAQALADGRWARNGRRWAYVTHQGIELPGRTAGLIGLGAIGKRVAARLKGFGMRLLAYDPYVSPETGAAFGVEMVDLVTLLREADFVSLHVVVTPETKGMIGAEEFALMKPTAYLINTARAALVDEQAMLEALREKRIAGAALDVYHHEPLSLDNPLLSLDNVTCTPHIGGASRDVVDHQSRMVVEGIIDFLEGRQPAFPVNLGRVRERFNWNNEAQKD